MDRRFYPGFSLATRQPLRARKTQMQVEKAEKNGNEIATSVHDLNPRIWISWPLAECLRATPGGFSRPYRASALQRRDRTPLPLETYAEPLTDALTPFAPHTAGVRQTPMNTDFPLDPILATRPPLDTRKTPIAIEKAVTNGNAF